MAEEDQGSRRGEAPLLDVRMLELLVCPLTKGPLVFDAAEGVLTSRLARLAYPVRDGIPVLLPSEARAIDPHAGGAAVKPD